MSTPEKVQILEDTSKRIQGVRGLYLADLSGMTVEKVSLLRKQCRAQKVQVRVVKNTLLKRAFNAQGITALDEYLVGPTGLIFSEVNEMAPAKILTDFAKEHEKPRIKAAVLDGRLFDDKAIAILAKPVGSARIDQADQCWIESLTPVARQGQREGGVEMRSDTDRIG